jgi:hypothetical protein
MSRELRVTAKAVDWVAPRSMAAFLDALKVLPHIGTIYC